MGGEFPGDRGLTGENKGLILIYFKYFDGHMKEIEDIVEGILI